jgi:hypothetical protein
MGVKIKKLSLDLTTRRNRVLLVVKLTRIELATS